MRHFPIFVNIFNHPILVIGGGKVALRKVKSIISAGGKITLIADSILPDIISLKNISIIQRKATKADITKNYKFVIIATNDNEANDKFASHCLTLDIIFNRVDREDKNSFTTGSVIDSSPILIAISTGAPEMSKLIKARIDKIISPELVKLSDIIHNARPKLKKSSNGRLLMKKLATDETLLEIEKNGFEDIIKEVNACL